MAEFVCPVGLDPVGAGLLVHHLVHELDRGQAGVVGILARAGALHLGDGALKLFLQMR